MFEFNRHGKLRKHVLLSVGLAIAAVLFVSFYMIRWNYVEGKLRAALEPVALSRSPGDAERARPKEGDSVILMVGDSRVVHWSPQLTIDGQTLIWRGVGGETVLGALQRLGIELDFWQPHRVVLATGINDLVAAALNPDRADDVRRNAIAGIRRMIKKVRAAGAEPVVVTIVPPARPGLIRRLFFWSDSIYGLVAATNQEIRDLAKSDGVLLIDAANVVGGSGMPLSEMYSVNSLHWNSSMYRRLNKLFENELNPQ